MGKPTWIEPILDKIETELRGHEGRFAFVILAEKSGKEDGKELVGYDAETIVCGERIALMRMIDARIKSDMGLDMAQTIINNEQMKK